MPELPEVETARRGIEPHLLGRTITAVVIRNGSLRHPIPPNLGKILIGEEITAVKRRGKYLLLETLKGNLIIHLGMSGSVRIVKASTAVARHDHFDLVCGTNILRLNDPRRFGAVLWQPIKLNPGSFNPLANLGIEPFDPAFTPHYLHQELRRRTGAIKTVLLSGKPVVGVGNIYASESLFSAGIHPNRAANRISLERCQKLHQAIQEILREAIRQGGSTLRDFVGSDGNPGYFQMAHQVYDRAGLPCARCRTPIRQIRQGQRSTFYCPHCQR